MRRLRISFVRIGGHLQGLPSSEMSLYMAIGNKYLSAESIPLTCIYRHRYHNQDPSPVLRMTSEKQSIPSPVPPDPAAVQYKSTKKSSKVSFGGFFSYNGISHYTSLLKSPQASKRARVLRSWEIRLFLTASSLTITMTLSR